VAEGIAKAVADGEDLGSKFEGSQQIRFLIEKEADGRPKVVGGWIEADDSGNYVLRQGGKAKNFAWRRIVLTIGNCARADACASFDLLCDGCVFS